MPFALFKPRPLPALAPATQFSRRLSLVEYYHASVGSSGKTIEVARENGIVVEGQGQLPLAQWRTALAAAAAANPGARLRLRGDCWRARWSSDGQPPALRLIENCAWDGYSEQGAELLYTTPLSLRDGPTVELLVIPRADGNTTLVLRTHHAVMDGLGTVHLYQEMFRALRGEPLLGSNATFSDVDLMWSVGARHSTSRHLPTESITGPTRGDQLGDLWRRVPLGKPVKNQLARVAEALADHLHRSSELPALVGVPVDLRRHAPGLRTTANFAVMLMVPLHKGERAEQFRLRLKQMLEHKMETVFPRILSIFKIIPLRWLDRMMGRTAKNYLQRKALETVVVSNLGKLDPQPLSAPGFTATSFWGIPIKGSAFVAISSTGETVEMTLNLTRERAGDGRLEALIAHVQQCLSQ